VAVAIKNAQLFQQAQHEIIERKRIESELIEERNLLKVLIDHIPYDIYTKDTDSRFTLVNKTLLERYQKMGISESDIIRKTDFDLFPLQGIPSDSAKTLYEEEQSIMQTGIPVIDRELPPYINPAHETMWVLQTKVPIQDQHGTITGLIGINYDISERKRAEQAIISSEKRLKAYANALPDRTIIFDRDGNYREILKENFAYRSNIVIPDGDGKSMYDVMEKDSADYFVNTIKQSIDTDTVQTIEYTLPYDSSIHLEAQIAPFSDPQTEERFVIWLSRDISERKKVAKTLRESEERYRGLFEYSPISLWEEDFSKVKVYIDTVRDTGVTDFQTYFEENPEEVVKCAAMIDVININQATLEMFGIESKNKFLEKYGDLSKSFTEEKHTSIRSQLLAVAEGKTEFEQELISQAQSKNARYITMRWSVTPGSEESLSRVLITMLDITDRKRMESKLVEEHNILRTLIDNLPYSIYMKDINSRFTLINKTVRERYAKFGITESEVIGQTDSELFPLLGPSNVENAKKFYEEEQLVMQTKQDVINVEAPPFRNSQDEVMWLLQTKIHITNQQGEVIGLVGMNSDITERKQIEQALRESEQHYRALFEGIGDAIVVYDEDANILDVNETTCHRLGYTREELLTMKITDIDAPDYAKNFKGRWEIQQTDGKLSGIIGAHITKNGRRIDIEANTTLIDFKGQPAVLGVVRDITERRQSEERYRGLFEYSPISLWEEDFTKIKVYIDHLRDSGITDFQKYFEEHPKEVVKCAAMIDILNINRATLEMFGIESKDEFLERRGDLSQYNSEENHTSIRNQLLAVAEGKTEFEQEIVSQPRTKNTKFITMRWSITPGYEESLSRVLISMLDITDRKRIESELAEERNILRTLIDHLPYEIYVKDINSRFTLINKSLLERYSGHGIIKSEIIGHTDFELFPRLGVLDPESAKRLYDEEQYIMRTGGAKVNIELPPFKDSQDNVIWTLQTKIRLHNQQGEVLGLVGMNSDISDRKQIEQDLREREQHYRALFEGIGDAVIVHDKDANILDVNKIACHRLGYTREELLTMKTTDIDAPDYAKSFNDRLSIQIAGGKIDNNIGVHIAKNGRRIDIEATTTLIDYKGQPAILGVVRDVTQRKQIEEQLQESEVRFRTLVHSLPMYISIKDTEGRFQYASPKTLKWYNVSSLEELRGMSDFDIQPFGLAARFFADEQEIIRTGQQRFQYEESYVDPVTGEKRWALSTKLPLRNSNILEDEGEIIGIVAVSTDITERKEAEQELREAKEAADIANQAKTTFLANMSHELRTPLNAILGFSQLLSSEQVLDTTHQQHISAIMKSGQHLLSIINDILEISRIEAGHTELSLVEFDLYQLFEDLEIMFLVQANTKELYLSFEGHYNIPQFYYADKGKLQQILINLVHNAIKFTQTGGVTLRVHYSETTKTSLHFTIQDTGIGLDPKDLKQLFEPFWQSTATQQLQQGTGLGLSIVYQFINQMRGEINVDSELNQGTTFTINIPITLGESKAKTVSKPAKIIGITGEKPTYRILIVDDEQDNRLILTSLMEGIGCEVQKAKNGQEALNIWESWEPHLIWMDLRMPIIDGYEATHRIKTDPRGNDTKIIILTATAFSQDEKEIMKTQCDDFLIKPIKHHDLFNLMRKHLNITFIYESKNQPSFSNFTQTNTSTNLVLGNHIPRHLIDELKQAAPILDTEAMKGIIEELHTYDPAIAKMINGWVTTFRFDRILEFLETNN
jgi:PAS domain S-box-containing protein